MSVTIIADGTTPPPQPQQQQIKQSKQVVVRSTTVPPTIIQSDLTNNNYSATLPNNNVVKPRVSFNRDVHVKRIGSRGSPEIIPALTGIDLGLGNDTNNTTSTNNENTRLLVLPVRRENLGHLSRKELAEEAAKVLKQADSVHCVSNRSGDFGPEKFYSLPSRKKNRIAIQTDSPTSSIDRRLFPRRRRRSEELGITTSTTNLTPPPKKPPRTFHSPPPPKPPTRTKKKHSFKNLFRTKSDAQTISQRPLVKINRSRSDVSDKKLRKRSSSSQSSSNDDTILVNTKKVPLSPIIEASPSIDVNQKDYFSVKDKEIPDEKVIDDSENMIHSSQKPVERLPLTRGQTVNHMVKRLSNERFSPPPKVGNGGLHNQPFSYISTSPDPIIYAQVVCSGNGPQKQTTHYKLTQNSDSDEGFGYEESNFQTVRGRGDGMDANKRQSLTDLIDDSFNDLSSRRELLESRINSRNRRFQNPGFTSETYLNHNGDLGSKEFHQSNPELIVQKRYEDVLESSRHRYYNEPTTQHDSLKRKDLVTPPLATPTHSDEDEGFQSSLLISTEKQHTEETPTQKKITTEYHTKRAEHRRKVYEYTRPVEKYQRNQTPTVDSDLDHSDLPRRHTPDYSRKAKQQEYVPRERSIDDGSHFDPRIDKDLEQNYDKKVLVKPPKADKKISSLDKVKNLFTSKKTKEKRAAKAASQLMVDEREMRARYSEYKGSKEDLDSKQEVDYNKRKKLATPRPSRSPTPTRNIKEPLSARKSAPDQTTSTLTRSKKDQENVTPNTGWFKSIDRLTRKNKKPIPEPAEASETDYASSIHKPQKSLRFFGDTDPDESTNETDKPKQQHTLHRRNLNTKPPISPYEQKSYTRPVQNGRLRRNDSLHEGDSTEGDSSQQSQRSVVYLHAATVGDIPGRHSRTLRSRATSRDELSNSSPRPQVKTLSRSFSVLAPWKPRPHYHEDIDYSQQPIRSTKTATSAVKSKIDSKNSNRSNGGLGGSRSTLNRRSKEDSKSTLSRTKRGENETLYKKREKNKKTMSLESLGNGGGRHRMTPVIPSDSEREKKVSRSVSMPRDKSAGWFGKKTIKA